MPEPFVVAFVVGVTPGKWARAWADRMRARPLTLLPLGQEAALAALARRTADVALLRLPVDDPALSTIPLYVEQPVVVAAKGHALEAADTVTLAELAEFVLLDPSDWAAAVELAAANVGVAVMPQSVARAHSRKDVMARPVTDSPETRVALAWRRDHDTPEVAEFIGIVRGRTANSSRGAAKPDEAAKQSAQKAKATAQRSGSPARERRSPRGRRA